MKRVEVYAEVRRAVYVEGISQREPAENAGVLVPPGYRRTRPPARPKLDPFLGIIDRILEEDKSQPAKQHHTAKRIFERLREMFAPLRHDPGHAQGDFGEAFAVIAGEERKIHFFAMDLPHSDACLVLVSFDLRQLVEYRLRKLALFQPR